MTTSMAAAKRSSLPTIISGLRIVAGPVVAGLILYANGRVFSEGGADAAGIYAWATALFLIAALSDALDGYLARRLDAVTTFGAALDHVADKVLLTCVLMALAATVLPTDLIVAAILLVARDVLIGGLREGLAQTGRAIPVGALGKWKTALAFLGAGAALALQPLALEQIAVEALPLLGIIIRVALWGAVLAALVSGALYIGQALRRA